MSPSNGVPLALHKCGGRIKKKEGAGAGCWQSRRNKRLVLRVDASDIERTVMQNGAPFVFTPDFIF